MDENKKNDEMTIENASGAKKEENVKKSFFARHGKKILAYALCFLAGAGVFWAGWLTHYFSQNENIRSLNFFLTNYDDYYFETRDGETDKNVTKILADAILDKYSEYYTAEEYAAETKSSRGEKKGLGLTFLSADFSIYSVNGNSPAEKAGVKAGGEVVGYKFFESEEYVMVSGDKKAALNDFISKANASESGNVFLKIKYVENGEDVVKEFSLQKAEYNESYVYYADVGGYYGYTGDKQLSLVPLGSLYGNDFGFDEKTGYIRLTQFNGLKSGTLGGAGQFKGALDMFKKNGRTQLILDLRGNGAVCVILSPSQNENGETVYKTYGKGIMQSTYINPISGEAVKLTTAKIYWPVSEICIHGKGVTADLNSEGYKVICGGENGILSANEYFASKNKTAV